MSYRCDVGFVTSTKGYEELKKILLEEDYEPNYYEEYIEENTEEGYVIYREYKTNICDDFYDLLQNALERLNELGLSYIYFSFDREQCEGQCERMENDGENDCGSFALPNILFEKFF